MGETNGESGEDILEFISRPHDKLFKILMRDEKNAADFLKHHLPPDLTTALDFVSLEILPESFLGPEFSEAFSDIILRVNLENSPAYIYVLFEHKSLPDDFAVWQLLNYMVRQWQGDMQKGAGLIPVIPLIFYHGEKQWTYKEFPELFAGLPENLVAYIPAFRYILHDLSGIPAEKIKGGIVLRLGQMLLKIATGEKPKEDFTEIIELLLRLIPEESGTRWLAVFIRYLCSVTGLHPRWIAEQFRKRKFHSGADIVMSAAKEILQQGIEQGIEQGIKRGKLEDAANLLQNGVSLEIVLRCTGLTREQLAQAGVLPAGN